MPVWWRNAAFWNPPAAESPWRCAAAATPAWPSASPSPPRASPARLSTYWATRCSPTRNHFPFPSPRTISMVLRPSPRPSREKPVLPRKRFWVWPWLCQALWIPLGIASLSPTYSPWGFPGNTSPLHCPSPAGSATTPVPRSLPSYGTARKQASPPTSRSTTPWAVPFWPTTPSMPVPTTAQQNSATSPSAATVLAVHAGSGVVWAATVPPPCYLKTSTRIWMPSLPRWQRGIPTPKCLAGISLLFVHRNCRNSRHLGLRGHPRRGCGRADRPLSGRASTACPAEKPLWR